MMITSLERINKEREENLDSGEVRGKTIGENRTNEKFADILADFYCDKKNQTKCQECLRRIADMGGIENLFYAAIQAKIQRGEKGDTEDNL